MDQNIFSVDCYTPVETAALFYVEIKVSTTESIQKHDWHYDHILLVLTVAGSDGKHIAGRHNMVAQV